MIAAYLEGIGGHPLEQFSEPTPMIEGSGSVIAMLYDMRDARRPGAMGTPAPIPTTEETVPRPGCWGPILPDSLDRTATRKE